MYISNCKSVTYQVALPLWSETKPATRAATPGSLLAEQYITPWTMVLHHSGVLVLYQPWSLEWPLHICDVWSFSEFHGVIKYTAKQ